jgi:hypothetical protein
MLMYNVNCFCKYSYTRTMNIYMLIDLHIHDDMYTVTECRQLFITFLLFHVSTVEHIRGKLYIWHVQLQKTFDDHIAKRH